MELGLKRTRNAVYQTAYHAVWIPKYRKKVLVGGVAERLRGILH
ncbi:MAG: transposase, partial [Candidatus Rokubacteria bacterium]|nr:transposase [Candidatus Rokubacteria bacterium]